MHRQAMRGWRAVAVKCQSRIPFNIWKLLRIDSTLKKMPDGRLAQRISPRRKGSHWTQLNRARCTELEQQGLMTDAGREAQL